MKKSTLYLLWTLLFIVCAGLGFIPEPTGALRVLLTILSAAFFVPPALLLRKAFAEKDAKALQFIRNLSCASLAFTAALLIFSILSVQAPQWVGNLLHALLVIASAPMICSGYWAASLFLWACLLFVSRKKP